MTSLRMQNENRRVEILARAGSMEGLRAAVGAGADAVYMGGVRFKGLQSHFANRVPAVTKGLSAKTDGRRTLPLFEALLRTGG